MNRFNRAALVAIGAMAFMTPLAAAGPDPVKGKDKTRMCAGCHGIEDYRIAYPEVYSIPRLGGQEPAYLTKELEDYRAGRRKSLPMEGVAASLSDQDIADIAAYYAAADPQSHGEVDHSGLKNTYGSCDGCHGRPDEKPTLPGAPKLAGQQYEYVVHALRAFRSGARASPIMGAVAKPLSDEDIRELARYYSTTPGLSAKY